MNRITASLTALIAAMAASASVAGEELNLYSSRHYDTDERLYSDFENATGITINRIEGKAAGHGNPAGLQARRLLGHPHLPRGFRGPRAEWLTDA